MKTTCTQQEILLITGTTFSSRQWCENNQNQYPLTEKEQLQVACWNGLIRQVMPEVFNLNNSSKLLYLWQIREAGSFIELQLAEFPAGKNKHFSIDPYSFLETQLHNWVSLITCWIPLPQIRRFLQYLHHTIRCVSLNRFEPVWRVKGHEGHEGPQRTRRVSS